MRQWKLKPVQKHFWHVPRVWKKSMLFGNRFLQPVDPDYPTSILPCVDETESM
jgi:hypothetical protein